jgi:hypothetical protein
MKLTYFRSSDPTRQPFGGERNLGIEAIPSLLAEVKARGNDVEFVDTASLTEKERIHWYSRVIVPAVYRHYEVKRILGTNRRSACFFGAEVPALLVTDQDGDPVGDTYPNRKGNRITTIHAFLTDLLSIRAESTPSRTEVGNR